MGPAGLDLSCTADQPTLSICESLGVPVGLDKLVLRTHIASLAIVLHSSAQQLLLPQDKLVELQQKIQDWLGWHKATKLELLSLIGKLSLLRKSYLQATCFYVGRFICPPTASCAKQELILNGGIPSSQSGMAW